MSADKKDSGVTESSNDMDEKVKIIKRYTNRKLYDTVDSRYVTLEEIAEMIRSGGDVRIIDNRSKEDLTGVTLAQIIFEQEKKKARMPLDVLKGFVRNSGDTLQTFIDREIQPRMINLREEAEHRIPKIFRKGEDGEIEAQARTEEALAHLKRSVEEWQHWADERVRDAASLLSMPGLQGDLDRIKLRIDDMRAKLSKAPAEPPKTDQDPEKR